MIFICSPLAYVSSVYTDLVRGISVKIENLSPQLPDEERVDHQRSIEEGLFEIFLKYDTEPDE